ncbi:hypothetical protein ACE4RR_12975 [Alteribacillus sp. HJP-4]
MAVSGGKDLGSGEKESSREKAASYCGKRPRKYGNANGKRGNRCSPSGKALRTGEILTCKWKSPVSGGKGHGSGEKESSREKAASYGGKRPRKWGNANGKRGNRCSPSGKDLGSGEKLSARMPKAPS